MLFCHLGILVINTRAVLFLPQSCCKKYYSPRFLPLFAFFLIILVGLFSGIPILPPFCPFSPIFVCFRLSSSMFVYFRLLFCLLASSSLHSLSFFGILPLRLLCCLVALCFYLCSLSSFLYLYTARLPTYLPTSN